MMKPLLIYCFDAYAEWCYGFIPVIKKLQTRFGNVFDIEVISGGLMISPTPAPVVAIAEYMLNATGNVEATSGMLFGKDFLWHMKNPDDSDWFPDSLKPATALCICKEYDASKQVDFANDLSFALFRKVGICVTMRLTGIFLTNINSRLKSFICICVLNFTGRRQWKISKR